MQENWCWHRSCATCSAFFPSNGLIQGEQAKGFCIKCVFSPSGRLRLIWVGPHSTRVGLLRADAIWATPLSGVIINCAPWMSPINSNSCVLPIRFWTEGGWGDKCVDHEISEELPIISPSFIEDVESKRHNWAQWLVGHFFGVWDKWLSIHRL